MAVVFFVGLGLMLVAPLLRPGRKESVVLACGSAAVLLVALVGLAHVDPRIGAAAIESNRRQYLLILACEIPVLALALFSLQKVKWAFWAGWAINLLFSIFVGVIVVWLEFFWHW